MASTKRRRFLKMAAAAYTVLGLLLCSLIARDFGVESTLFVILVGMIPAVISPGISMRMEEVTKRDVLYLMTLKLLVLVSLGGLVHVWYENGLDERHRRNQKFAELRRLIQNEPDFRGVEAQISGKQMIYLEGTVHSASARSRLEQLADHYGVSVEDDRQFNVRMDSADEPATSH